MPGRNSTPQFLAQKAVQFRSTTLSITRATPSTETECRSHTRLQRRPTVCTIKGNLPSSRQPHPRHDATTRANDSLKESEIDCDRRTNTDCAISSPPRLTIRKRIVRLHLSSAKTNNLPMLALAVEHCFTCFKRARRESSRAEPSRETSTVTEEASSSCGGSGRIPATTCAGSRSLHRIEEPAAEK